MHLTKQLQQLLHAMNSGRIHPRKHSTPSQHQGSTLTLRHNYLALPQQSALRQIESALRSALRRRHQTHRTHYSQLRQHQRYPALPPSGCTQASHLSRLSHHRAHIPSCPLLLWHPTGGSFTLPARQRHRNMALLCQRPPAVRCNRMRIALPSHHRRTQQLHR
jgi:hypothetical protein